MGFVETSPLGIWLVALAIVALDSIILLPPGTHVLIANTGGTPRDDIVSDIYLLRGRQPIVTLLAYPFRPFIVGAAANSGEESIGEKTRDRIAQFAADCTPIRIVSATTLGLVLLVGPSVSWFAGLRSGILLAWPIAYVMAFVGLALAFARRGRLGLGAGALSTIAVELLVCPFLTANLVKKIAARQPTATFTEASSDHHRNQSQPRGT